MLAGLTRGLTGCGYAVRRVTQRGEIEFAHPEHRLHGPLCPSRSGPANNSQAGRHDLPGNPVSVRKPTTLPLLTALGQPLSVRVELALGLAADLEGDGLVERELWAIVDADEPLTVPLELHGRHHAGRSRPSLCVAGDVDDA